MAASSSAAARKSSTTTQGERRDWPGRGFIRTDSTGERTYYIEMQIEGRRFTLSTGAHTEEDADKEWARFRANPAAYQQPRRVVEVEGALVLDEKLAERFLDWSEKKGNRAGRTRRRKGCHHPRRYWCSRRPRLVSRLDCGER